MKDAISATFYMLIFAVLAMFVLQQACSEQGAKTAKDAGVRIADDICKEESSQPSDPTLVAIVCGVDTIVHVVLPKAAWHAAKVAGKDGGPGK